MSIIDIFKRSLHTVTPEEAAEIEAFNRKEHQRTLYEFSKKMELIGFKLIDVNDRSVLLLDIDGGYTNMTLAHMHRHIMALNRQKNN